MPALAAGNAVLYKPSEYATLTGRHIADLLHEAGVPADVFVLVAGDGERLPLVSAAAPELDPLCAIQSFYLLAEALARARGRDPDAPPHLSKVTRTRCATPAPRATT